jgi:hypothetical protein
MNEYDTNPDPSDTEPVADLLSRTLSQEADLVDPSPGALQSIQRRTAKQTPSRKPWVLGTVGAGLAAAAVITAIVVVSDNGSDPSGSTPPAATQPTEPGEPQQHEGVYDPTADPANQITMYYVGPREGNPEGPGPGDAARLPRLYGEPHTVELVDDTAALTAVHEFLTSRPIDPDYLSGWPEGVDIENISTDGGITTFDLVGDADLASLGDLTPGQGAAAVQAFLRTAGESGPAAFTYNGDPVDILLGANVSEPEVALADADVRAFISIDNIVDGQTVTAPVTVKVSGNVFEGTVNWILSDADGDKVDEGFTTTSMGAWTQADVELGDLAPGTYTFTALEYSAADGDPMNADTKTFTVE